MDFFFSIKFISKFITSCGITPFEHIVSADHRASFLDIIIAQYSKNPFVDTVDNISRLLQ